MDVHSLKLLARSPFLSDYTRSKVMRLCSSVSCSASTATAPPSWIASPAACSIWAGRPAVPTSVAGAHLGALQGLPAAETFGRMAGSFSGCLRPGRRRHGPGLSSRVAAKRSTLAGRTLMQFDSAAVMEGHSQQEQDAREADLQGKLRIGEIAGAYAEFERLKGGNNCPSAMACDGLILGLCSCGQYRKAWGVFKLAQLESYKLRYMPYQALLSASIQAGEVYNALRAFRAIEAAGLLPNVITCCGLISALGRGRRQAERRQAYHLWRQLQGSGQCLDAAAYRTGINACVGEGHLGEARALLVSMRELGMPPDLRAYNILLKGASRSGDLAALDQLLAALRSEGLEASRVTYNTVVDAYVRAGQLSRAAQALAAANAEGVVLDAWSWSSLVKGHVQAGNLQEGLALLRAMDLAGVEPNEVTYTTLIDGFTRVGNLKGARDLLKEMHAKGLQPNDVTYNILLRGYALQGYAHRGATFELLKEMSDSGVGPTGATFNTLMDAAIECGDPEAALRLFAQMQDTGFTPDTVSFTTMIKAYTRLERTEDAILTFRQMEANPDIDVDLTALNLFVDALSRGGRMEAAERVLLRASEAARLSGYKLPAEAHGAVIAGYARLRDVDGALATLRAFHRAGGVPDAQMFGVLMDVCIKEGHFKRALQVIRAMERTGTVTDKAKYKHLLAELQRREGQQRPIRGDSSGGHAKNEHLERFKFWLGMPNKYFEGGDWDWHDREY